MSEEQKKMIRETVENMKQMDMNSLLVMRSGSELLRARDKMGERDKEPEKKVG